MPPDIMKKTILMLFGLALWIQTRAMTGDSISYITFRDTIILSVENGEKFYTHVIQKGQTLFSLARFYGLHYQELQYFNAGLGEQVSIGQKVRIPIPNRAIVRYLPKNAQRWEYAPVMYQVRKGDTVFRIGQYFKMPTDTVSARGKIVNNNLRLDMLIPVGWMSVKGIKEEDRPEPAHPMLKKNLPLRQRFESAMASKKTMHKKQGPAFWQKNGPQEGASFYARFNDAPARSVIEIENPMTQGKIFAEVLGPIPPTIYDPRVVVVLSPAAAKMLGARDPQFFVKIRFYK